MSNVLLLLLRASVRAFTLKVSCAPISVESSFSMTLPAGGAVHRVPVLDLPDGGGAQHQRQGADCLLKYTTAAAALLVAAVQGLATRSLTVCSRCTCTLSNGMAEFSKKCVSQLMDIVEKVRGWGPDTAPQCFAHAAPVDVHHCRACRSPRLPTLVSPRLPTLSSCVTPPSYDVASSIHAALIAGT